MVNKDDDTDLASCAHLTLKSAPCASHWKYFSIFQRLVTAWLRPRLVH